MREFHKLKDKAEFSLDTRQIFFLFFGLSVVGCFVFGLGVITGRNLDWQAEGPASAEATDDAASLASLAADRSIGSESLATVNGQPFAFKQGLAESEAENLPPTRPPGEPPRNEKELKAERKAARLAEKGQKATAKTAAENQPSAPKVAAKAESKPVSKPERKPQTQTKVAKNQSTNVSQQVFASGQPSSKGDATKADKKGKRRFTLQLKAFSNGADAEEFSQRLTKNGHSVRVEVTEARGRQWHRVRLGSFKTWAEAVEAKDRFEKSEKLIAYVVAQ